MRIFSLHTTNIIPQLKSKHGSIAGKSLSEVATVASLGNSAAGACVTSNGGGGGGNERTSIMFTLNNQVGGLARALQVFQELGINVLHLELQNSDSKVEKVSNPATALW